MVWTHVKSYDNTQVTVYRDGGTYMAVKTGLSYDPAVVESAIMDADHYDTGVEGAKIKYVKHAQTATRFSPTDLVYTQALNIPFNSNPTVVRLQVQDSAAAGRPDYLEIGWSIYCLGEACQGKNTAIDAFLAEYGTDHLDPNNGQWIYEKQADGTYNLTQILTTDLGIAETLGGGPSTLAGNVNGMAAFIAAHAP